MTVKNLRAALRKVAVVFVNVTYSPDDCMYIEVSKAAVLRAFKGMPGNCEVGFTVRHVDELYIDAAYCTF